MQRQSAAGALTLPRTHLTSRFASRDNAMNRYRNTTTVEIRTEDELTTSPAEEIEGLDEEDYLSNDVKLRGDAAIREYIIECCLVGIYESVDEEWP
jgi:hypothetical protein